MVRRICGAVAVVAGALAAFGAHALGLGTIQLLEIGVVAAGIGLLVA